MTTRNARVNKTTRVAQPATVGCKYKANPARGEVAEIINGVHCWFVPSYQNIAVIEQEVGGSIIQVIQEMSEGIIVVSKVVPILVHLNDGDDLSYDEAYRWLASAQSDPIKQRALVNIAYAVIDPEGKRFVAQTESEAEENPNS